MSHFINTILFDARISSRTNITGVERVVQELIKKIKLTYPEKFKFISPLFDNRIYQNLWVQGLLPLYCLIKKHKTLFAPANNAPIFLSNSVKLITIIHDLSHLYYPTAYSFYFRNYYKFLIPKIIDRSDLIFTVSSSEREKIIEYFPQCKNKIHFFYNGISEEFKVEEEYTSQKKGILYVGSISKRKNFVGVLKAFALLYKNISHDLYIVGSRAANFTNDTEIQTMLTLIPPTRVHFMGSINSSKELCKVYNKMYLLLFPSFSESFGLPVAEAMRCGTPSIISNIPALKEITDGHAVICDQHNPTDIAEKVQLMINDYLLYSSMRKNGIERSNLFTWQHSTERIIKIIDEFESK